MMNIEVGAFHIKLDFKLTLKNQKTEQHALELPMAEQDGDEQKQLPSSHRAWVVQSPLVFPHTAPAPEAGITP